MGIAADFCLIVVAGFAGALLARVLRLPLLIGYIAAGVAVGPYTAGPTVVQIHDIELLAEIGVALLLFSLGLELSLADLKPVWRVSLLGGPAQILLTIAAGAAAAVLIAGVPMQEAIWLGAMISLSSTMVVLKNLAASGTTGTLASRVMIGLLVVQDLAVVPILVILPQLGGSLQDAAVNVAKASGIAGVFLAAAILLGSRLLPRMMTVIARWGSQELFLVALVAVGVGVGFAAYSFGISFALGAFIAGIVLSESELSHQALSDIIPLRDIFGLLFFVSVGMLFDPGYVLRHPAQVAILIALIVTGKALIAGGIVRAFGYGNLAPWVAGLGLAQIGEFSFVLARSGKTLGVLSKDTYDLALTCTILTIAVSPSLASAAAPIGRLVRARFQRSRTLDTVVLPVSRMEDHVVVAGAGRIGRTVTDVLKAAGLEVLLIDFDHNRYRQAVADGLECVYGDVTRVEVLHAARIESARMLVVAVPNAVMVQVAVRQTRKLHPDLAIVARAAGREELPALQQAGGERIAIVQPEFEGGLEMARRVMESCCGKDKERSLTQELLAAARSRFLA